MQIIIHSKALIDPRFKALGVDIDMSWFDALGRCAVVWALGYERRLDVLSHRHVDGAAERKGFAAAMVAAELAEDLGDGTVRVLGMTDQLEWLAKQDYKRGLAKAAKAAKCVHRATVDAVRQADSSHGDSQGTSHGNSHRDVPLVLVLDPVLDQKNLSPAHDPPVQAPTPMAMGPEVSDRRRKAARFADEVWSQLATAHSKLRLEGIDPTTPALSPMPDTESPGWKLAVERCTSLLDRHPLDEAKAIAKHRLDVAIAEARSGDPPTLKYFAPPRFFHPASWEVATTTSVESVAMARAGPRGSSSTSRREPDQPRRIRDFE